MFKVAWGQRDADEMEIEIAAPEQLDLDVE